MDTFPSLSHVRSVVLCAAVWIAGPGFALGREAIEPPKDNPQLEDPFKDKGVPEKELDPEELFPEPDSDLENGNDNGVDKARSPKELGHKRGWAIILATLSKEGHEEEIGRLRQDFVDATGLTECWVDSTPKRSVLFYGNYKSPDDPRVKTDLSTIKRVQIGGQEPFKRVFLSPTGDDPSLAKALAGSRPEYNLRNVRIKRPELKDAYTLQIALYEAEEGQNATQARRAAEEFVKQLRAQGYEAFYYHSESTSTVTLGVFGEDAIDAQAGIYSPEVERMRKKFPFNAYNGRELKERVRTRDNKVVTVRQPSFLVVIPDTEP